MKIISAVLRNHGKNPALKPVRLAAAATLAVLLASAQPGHCANGLINLQLSGDGDGLTAYSGAAIIGSEGDVWNLEVGGSNTNAHLVDSTGASTGVTVSYTSQFDGALAEDLPGFYGFYGTTYANLMRGYIFAFTDAERPITFSGLVANSAYSLYVYTQGDSGADDRELTVTANGNTTTSTPAVASASTFIAGQNYITLTGTSNSSGVLSLTYNFAAGEADINGIQLSGPMAVPEPSTCLLMGAAAVVGLRMFSRRRKA